eukprot:CAMPEP_0115162460 /NCGR_PEP_ID=MMETSP0227-20121206/71971_1 /TAXON_ID=89957 /ORGANISM="Polarella glacialis, Strain CCMP 1383" /LENGTH=145 /DNA_ID=CAMNT_0002574667 /DNA_START=15 /DNA_END=450 /DNA_ORIENTATION=+
MGCSASVSRRKERSMSHFAQVVPADDVRREASPPPHAIGRKTNSLFHKAAAKGGEQPVPAAWQDGAAQAKDGSLKVNGHSLDENVDARFPDVFNRATVVPEPSGLESISSRTSAGTLRANSQEVLKRLDQALEQWEESPSYMVGS